MTPHCTLVPSLLNNQHHVESQRLALCEGVVDQVHIDIADGSFTNQAITVDTKVLGNWDTNIQYQLHLMVEDPHAALKDWVDVKNISEIIVHAEAKKLRPEALAVQAHQS